MATNNTNRNQSMNSRRRSILAKTQAVASRRTSSLSGTTVTCDLSSDIAITPRRIFVDRAAGSVSYERLFGDVMNSALMIRHFRDDADLQKRIASFYSEMKIEEVLKSECAKGFFKVSDNQFGLNSFREAIEKMCPTHPADADLIVDHLRPILREAGFNLPVGTRFATRLTHGRRDVTVTDLINDTIAQACSAILSKARITSLGKERYHADVLANLVACDLRPLGGRLLSMPNFVKVFDCAVIGVRANLDRTCSAFEGVPAWLRDHPVIVEFSSNLTFIGAAMKLAALPSAAVVSLGDRDLDAALTSLAITLKSSLRYADVRLTDLVDEMTLTHEYDYNEELAGARLTCNSAYIPGIMTARAINGRTGMLAFLDEPSGRVGEVIDSYNLGAFDMKAVAAVCATAFSARVNDPARWTATCEPEVIEMSMNDMSYNMASLVAMTQAERIAVRPVNTAGAASGFINYFVKETLNGEEVERLNLVYTIRAAGKRWSPVVRNKLIDRNLIITTDTALVVLAAKPFTATRDRSVGVQIPDAKIYGVNLVAVPSTIVSRLNRSLKFSFTVGSVALAGEFVFKELAALHSTPDQCFLVNDSNTRLANAMFNGLAAELVDENDIKQQIALNGAVYNHVIDSARKLSKSFREELQYRIVEKAVSQLDVPTSVAMRSTYNRALFKAQIDMFALRLYLDLIGAQEAMASLAEIMTEEGFALTMAQRGSDRDLD